MKVILVIVVEVFSKGKNDSERWQRIYDDAPWCYSLAEGPLNV